jgi:hypothetical protein
LVATALVLAATGFFAGLAALFFSALRAEADGAGLALTVTDDFDFAAVFFGLATALAMTENDPLKVQEIERLTPLWAARRKPSKAATYR